MNLSYPKTNPLRRRLTVDRCDAVKEGSGTGSSEVDRGLIQTMQGDDVLAYLNDAEKASANKIAFSTNTDKNLKRRQSFEEKDHVCEGKTGNTTNSADVKKTCADMGIGACCKKGLKPESPNQDSFSVVLLPGLFHVFGVYDGHGPVGHDISNFCRKSIMKQFLSSEKRESNPSEALVDAFVSTQKMLQSLTDGNEMDCRQSGTTCTVLFHNLKEKVMYVAHTGDSRAVLAQKKGDKWVAKDLTEDHKPNLPVEKERIEKAGGRVVFDGYFNHRVFTKDGQGGLNMSRALGDCIAHKAGVTEVPETKVLSAAEVPLNSETFVLLCSDGVWEFLESQDAVDIVAKYGRKDAQAASEELARTSWDKWIEDSDGEVSDDITAIVYHI